MSLFANIFIKWHSCNLYELANIVWTAKFLTIYLMIKSLVQLKQVQVETH